MNSVIGYIRVSTTKQAEEGVSIEMQKNQILHHCLTRALIQSKKEIQFFIDDGYSGSSFIRPAITKVLQLINDQKVKYLLAYDFSRISRNISDGVQFLNLLQQKDVSIECIHDDISILSASGRFSTNIKMAVNQYEREKIIERTNDGLRQVARSGKYPYGGKIMYGYRRKKDNTLAILPKEVTIIKGIYSSFLDGASIADITKSLNLSHSKANYNSQFIRWVLKNERYTGKFIYKNEEYKNIIPAIISPEDFQKVSKKLATKTRKNSSYLFAGKTHCSCGNIMTCTHGTGKQGTKYYYYQCKPCKSIISEKDIIEAIDGRFIEIHCYDTIITTINNEINKYKTKLSRIEQQYVSGRYTPEQYLQVITPLQHSITSNVKQKKALQKAGRVLTIGQIAPSNQKQYVDQFLASITIDAKKREIISIKMK